MFIRLANCAISQLYVISYLLEYMMILYLSIDLVPWVLCLIIFTLVLSAPHHQSSLLVWAWFLWLDFWSMHEAEISFKFLLWMGFE